jgi:transposase-like protein
MDLSLNSPVPKKNALPTAPTVLPVAARREAERSEADRSAVTGKTVPTPPPAVAPQPDPEVIAAAKRRTFNAEYKQRILAEADTAPPGGIGALLRREGLYSSHLVTWRRERQAGIVQGLRPQKRGPKPKRNPLEEENQKLRHENLRLTETLRKAEIIIEVQKKVGALLGWPLPKADPQEKP